MTPSPRNGTVRWYDLWAPPEYWSASPEMIENIGNGLGPKGWGWFIPDSFFGLPVHEAGDIHDWMYFFQKGKDNADKAFLKNLLEIVRGNSRFFVVRWLRMAAAWICYQAVKRGGKAAYDKAIQ